MTLKLFELLFVTLSMISAIGMVVSAGLEAYFGGNFGMISAIFGLAFIISMMIYFPLMLINLHKNKEGIFEEEK